MNPGQILVSQAVKAALLVALVGVCARGRYRQCISFPVYLVLVLICDTLVSLWPHRFYVHWFWILQQSAWDLAKLAVALELGFRFFRAFPGARSVARLMVTAVTLATTGAVISLPAGLTFTAAALEWQPRVLTGTIWLMTILALLVVWYRLPIHPFQAAILIGFVPYLVVFVTLANVLRAHGWGVRPWVNLVDASCYLAAAAWWAFAAWRPNPAFEMSPTLLRRIGVEFS
jgi:hypothetical protein